MPFKNGIDSAYEKEFKVELSKETLIWYAFDAGFTSPMKNLETVLKLNRNSKHRGIFQMHDDLLLNFTHMQLPPNWDENLISECEAKSSVTLQKLEDKYSEYKKWGHWYGFRGLKQMKRAELDENIPKNLLNYKDEKLIWGFKGQSDFVYLPKKAFDKTLEIIS